MEVDNNEGFKHSVAESSASKNKEGKKAKKGNLKKNMAKKA